MPLHPEEEENIYAYDVLAVISIPSKSILFLTNSRRPECSPACRP